MIPLTSYFQRKTRKENVHPPKKRKQNPEQPAGSSKKVKVDVPTRYQLSERTRSLNKRSFSAAASSSTSHTRTTPRTTPSQRSYATPKSLVKGSNFRNDANLDDIVDLTAGPSGTGDQSRPDTEANPFLIQTPKPIPSVMVQSAASKFLPPTPCSSIRSHSSGMSRPKSTPIADTLTRQAMSRSIIKTTPKRSSKDVLEIIPETPESPTIRPSKALSELPDLSQIPSSQTQEVEIDFLANRKGVSVAPQATNGLYSLSHIPTSQNQEVVTDSAAHNEHARLPTQATTEESFEVPTSQSQEVVVDLSIYRRHDVDTPPSDGIVPCSQSQDFDGIFLEAVSPRRKRVLHEIEEAKRLAATTDHLSSPESQIVLERTRPNIESQPSFSSKLPNEAEAERVTEDVADTTLNTEDIILHAANEDIPKSQAIQRSDSDHAMVPMNDEDIRSLFENERLLSTTDDSDAIANANQHKEVDLPPMPSQASSVTESDSGDEQWMLQAQNLSRVEIVANDGVLTSLPSSPSEVQSWQTDVSAYSYPQAALDFFEMLEEGPDGEMS
ncbi:hypothetical protein DFH05DRAFT_1525611 [Lentinula detonsa]|uniref:Uncharacterized protein n=1 Tax=Lentinula detonsa TaxID=2804962 RepID=A0A9W8NYE9_9AGAR|nr:hypothetical protein DFH05DRAFT_1525611 [Lentinula detonsa]KAJ3990298.1 hypothetical protein F5890DRAFT_451974 [Lentinula detonsa]